MPSKPTNAPAASAKSGEVDVCGVGKVTLNENDSMALSRRIDVMTEKTRARWRAALLSSDDPRARAVGLFIQGMNDPKTEQPAAQAARDELVQLAVGAADPAIYSLALQRCSRIEGLALSPGGACPQISWRGWARLEPDNAVPWLMLAGAAHAANDTAAEADAIDHASKSQKVESYNAFMFTFALPELPKDATPLERAFLGIEMIGIEAANYAPQYSSTSRYCSVNAMRDLDVQTQCSALAELLIGKGGDLLAFAIGESIGRRAGWPAARVDALAQEKNAMKELSAQVTPMDDPNPFGCAAVDRLNDFFDLRSRLGEIAALRELRERSGESREELARQWAESLEKIRATAAQEQAQARAAEAPASGAQ